MPFIYVFCINFAIYILQMYFARFCEYFHIRNTISEIHKDRVPPTESYPSCTGISFFCGSGVRKKFRWKRLQALHFPGSEPRSHIKNIKVLSFFITEIYFLFLLLFSTLNYVISIDFQSFRKSLRNCF